MQLKFLERISLRSMVLVILTLSTGLMGFLIYDLNKTEHNLAQSLINGPMDNADTHLHDFFDPVENILLTVNEHASSGQFDSISPESMNRYFVPLIRNFSQISSIGIANTDGFEYDVLPSEKTWHHRMVWIDSLNQTEFWQSWIYDSRSKCWKKTAEWTDQVKHDPRIRPWFTGAMNSPNNSIIWTRPYLYNTNGKLGITASIKWNRPNDKRNHVIAFDLTLSDISSFTQNMHVSRHGKAFVLTDSGFIIGLPNEVELIKQADNRLLTPSDLTNAPEMSIALREWNRIGDQQNKAFLFKVNGEKWWGQLRMYNLGNRDLIIGVVIPETDVLTEVQHSKSIILGSFIIILIMTAVVLYSYSKSQKINMKLVDKNKEITEKKLIIESKNKDILDSIHYAKRIQKAILPSNQTFSNLLPDSFVIYEPKDIVAGDFYWLHDVQLRGSKGAKPDTVVYFAVADCTGHGVPGAIVSFICSGALSKALIEENKIMPSKLLDRTRELVIQQLGRSDADIKDGMDISLCALNLDTLEIQWSGANNPIWIMRQDGAEIEEIKGDRQPIGRYTHSFPFSEHTIQLHQGDVIYIFTDGFSDQFGGTTGKKYKSKRLKEFLLFMHGLDMETQKSLLENEFINWRGDFEQIDDVCFIGVKV